MPSRKNKLVRPHSERPILWFCAVLLFAASISGCGGRSSGGGVEPLVNNQGNNVIIGAGSVGQDGGKLLEEKSGAVVTIPAGAFKESAKVEIKQAEVPPVDPIIKELGFSFVITADKDNEGDLILETPVSSLSATDEELSKIEAFVYDEESQSWWELPTYIDESGNIVSTFSLYEKGTEGAEVKLRYGVADKALEEKKCTDTGGSFNGYYCKCGSGTYWKNNIDGCITVSTSADRNAGAITTYIDILTANVGNVSLKSPCRRGQYKLCSLAVEKRIASSIGSKQEYIDVIQLQEIFPGITAPCKDNTWTLLTREDNYICSSNSGRRQIDDLIPDDYIITCTDEATVDGDREKKGGGYECTAIHKRIYNDAQPKTVLLPSVLTNNSSPTGNKIENEDVALIWDVLLNDGSRLRLINVHTMSPANDGLPIADWDAMAPWSEGLIPSACHESRKKQIQTILSDYYSNRENVLITGDFNTGSKVSNLNECTNMGCDDTAKDSGGRPARCALLKSLSPYGGKLNYHSDINKTTHHTYFGYIGLDFTLDYVLSNFASPVNDSTNCDLLSGDYERLDKGSGMDHFAYECYLNLGEAPSETCSTHASKGCYGGNAYWYNSCAEKEDLYDTCTTNETCAGGQCVPSCQFACCSDGGCSGATSHCANPSTNSSQCVACTQPIDCGDAPLKWSCVNYSCVANYTASVITSSQSPAANVVLQPGETRAFTIGYTNTGHETWYKTGEHPVHLGTDNPTTRVSPFAHSSWLGNDRNRPAALTENSVIPGAQGTFTFTVQAPTTPGAYPAEYFAPVAEGVTFMNQKNVYWTITVASTACGNGMVETGETCDDGNTISGDGCSAACQTETGAVCGNGAVETGEQCDDDNTVTETCAYGQTSCAVCSSTCQSAAGTVTYCGDGTVQSANGETCDDGASNGQPNKCNSTCNGTVPANCGNGIVETGEQCDDGNTATEACAYGQTSCTVCNSSCQNGSGTTTYCGDGTVNGAENCDDGNTTSGDGCSSACLAEAGAVCGNGTVESGEQCDDGNTTSGDGCSSSCQTEVSAICGNGAVETGEQCDDSNTVSGDGCSGACQTESAPPSGNEWITIPAGDFVMGCDITAGICYSSDGEMPKHTVYLSEYKIQKYEVTNAQYRACVDDSVCAPEFTSSWTGDSYYGNTAYDNYPVIHIYWNQATIYCGWLGGRLPTEAEWEKAARGPYPREPKYPWGNDFTNCTHANSDNDDSSPHAYCVGHTSEVGSYPMGASYYGVLDMAGNVQEWVNDWFASDYYTTGGPPWNDPQGPESGLSGVVRGGSWNNPYYDLRTYSRYAFSKTASYYLLGFRCAQDSGGLSVVCGNSIVETGEQCDDGNTTTNDGCSETCQTETSNSWAKTFGGTGTEEYGRSIQQTTDGGYIVEGYTESYGAGFADLWIVKLDSSGSQVWAKTFGGTGYEMAKEIQQTTDGGYIVGGKTNSYGAGSFDLWILKLDAEGNQVWAKTFGGTGSEVGSSIQQTTDGGYIVAGNTDSYGAGFMDIWVLKLDAEGNQVWAKTIGGTGTECAKTIRQATDGGYIVLGDTGNYDGNCVFSLGVDPKDPWVLKLDSEGNQVWAKTGEGYGNSIQQTTDGGYVVAGGTDSYDISVIKLDTAGNQVWAKIIGGSGSDNTSSIQQTTDGGYIVGGITDSYGAGSRDFWILKLDAEGNQNWAKTFGGTSDETARAIQQTTDGGYVVAGQTSSYGAGGLDLWVLKLDSSGNCTGPGCP